MQSTYTAVTTVLTVKRITGLHDPIWMTRWHCCSEEGVFQRVTCVTCKSPSSKGSGFLLSEFHVTLVQLRLWGKPSLSCQSSWCALSQTIYWCWVQISSVSWLLGLRLSYLSINVQLSKCSLSETLSASRQWPAEAWYNMGCIKALFSPLILFSAVTCKLPMKL